MRYCCQRLQTDRNTASRLKIDFWFFKYNWFFCYNGFITDFLDFYWFSTNTCFFSFSTCEMPPSNMASRSPKTWCITHFHVLIRMPPSLGLHYCPHISNFVLKNTAMVAQEHVASELRMRLWTSRSRTDRNTPSRLKIDLGKSGYNGFFCYNGYNGF